MENLGKLLESMNAAQKWEAEESDTFLHSLLRVTEKSSVDDLKEIMLKINGIRNQFQHHLNFSTMIHELKNMLGIIDVTM